MTPTQIIERLNKKGGQLMKDYKSINEYDCGYRAGIIDMFCEAEALLKKSKATSRLKEGEIK